VSSAEIICGDRPAEDGDAKTISLCCRVAGEIHPTQQQRKSVYRRRRRDTTMLVGRLAFAALLSGVAAQVGVGVPGVYNSLYGGSHLCNRSFADANLVRGRQNLCLRD
jgi:hypothetical protein